VTFLLQKLYAGFNNITKLVPIMKNYIALSIGKTVDKNLV